MPVEANWYLNKLIQKTSPYDYNQIIRGSFFINYWKRYYFVSIITVAKLVSKIFTEFIFVS